MNQKLNSYPNNTPVIVDIGIQKGEKVIKLSFEDGLFTAYSLVRGTVEDTKIWSLKELIKNSEFNENTFYSLG